MSIMSKFPSRYLKGDDIEVGAVLTIKGVQFEEVGFEKEEKPVVYFEEELRGCVCNKTIARTLVKAFGDDEATWPGRNIAPGPMQPRRGDEFKHARYER